ncbi:MAG: hypothetical protein PVI03_00910 [Candidatus Thorarchaeota archaeon]|jgi:hypothetical protein
MMMPKALQKVIGKVDPRAKPDPERAKRFKEGAGRRYMNVGIATIDFYHGIAKEMKDKELKECAETIEKAVYDKDDMLFKAYTIMFRARMSEMGVWKSVKGMSSFQKAKIMGKIAKVARREKKKKEEEENKRRNVEKYKDDGAY